MVIGFDSEDRPTPHSTPSPPASMAPPTNPVNWCDEVADAPSSAAQDGDLFTYTHDPTGTRIALRGAVAGGHAMTGTASWFGARNLADFVLGGGVAPGARVLELGCGLGLAGFVAAARGCAVVMTDGDDGVLALCAANAARCARQPDSMRRLFWGDAADVSAALEAHGRFDTVLVSPRPVAAAHPIPPLTPLPAPQAADCIFEAAHAGPLFATAAALGAPAGHRVVVALTRRTVGVDDVVAAAAEAGYGAPALSYMYDIFGNDVEELTVSWQHAVLEFRWSGSEVEVEGVSPR